MALTGLIGSFEAAFAVVGCLVVLMFVLTTLWAFTENVYAFYFGERLGRTVDYKNLGEWAVVTGATDGIGKGFALDLARRGYNIVQISRSEDKLRDVAREIEASYKVRTKTIAVDFGNDESIYDGLKEELTKLEIGTLINNVGVAYPYPEFLHRVPGDEAFFIRMLRINCMAQTLMTRIVVPQMVARKKGCIIHLSSAAGNQPMPLMAVYSASKAYNAFFGQATQQEYKKDGILSQVITPYTVATNMTGIKESNLFIVDSKKYARSCLNTVRLLKNSNGHPSHSIQNWILMNIPTALNSYINGVFLNKWRNQVLTQMKTEGPHKE